MECYYWVGVEIQAASLPTWFLLILMEDGEESCYHMMDWYSVSYSGCSLFLHEPMKGLGVPHYRLAKGNILIAHLAFAGMSGNEATFFSVVFIGSGAAI